MKKKPESIIKENIPELMELYFDFILSRDNAKRYTETQQKKVIDAVEKILPRLPVHTPSLRATNTESVLKLLRRGKLTINEAKDLMSIMTAEFEIKQLPELMEKLELLSNDQ